MKDQTFLVVGNTEVGATIASRLMAMGQNILYVGRKNAFDTVYNVESAGSIFANLKLQSFTSIKFSTVTAAFFCMRSYDLKGSIERYISYLPKGIPVIVVCPPNFLDNLRIFTNQQPDILWRIAFVTFDTALVSEVIYRLKCSGALFWGPVYQRSNLSFTALESQLESTSHGFFRPKFDILGDLPRRWLFELVVGSIGLVQNIDKHIKLLDDLSFLKEVSREGYRLGCELFGAWSCSFEQIFGQLVSYLSSDPERENVWYRYHQNCRRTDNRFFAKLATNRLNYDYLTDLSNEIERRESTLLRKNKSP